MLTLTQFFGQVWIDLELIENSGGTLIDGKPCLLLSGERDD
jgi:hypothetical protein